MSESDKKDPDNPLTRPFSKKEKNCIKCPVLFTMRKTRKAASFSSSEKREKKRDPAAIKKGGGKTGDLWYAGHRKESSM